MWCSSCQQDVPGLIHATSGRVACSRCQQTFATAKSTPSAQICDDGLELDGLTAATMAAPPRLDPWASGLRMKELSRELQRPTIVRQHAASAPRSQHRYNLPDELFGRFEQVARPLASAAPVRSGPRSPANGRPNHWIQAFAWLITLIGAVVLAAGIGLIAWSLAGQHGEYWNLAIGLALAGQGTLILGLVMLISRLWRNSRYATMKIQDVHARLGQLQRTADALVATRAGGSGFYADLVRGASPHVLLANLKGQLEQLAGQIGNS